MSKRDKGISLLVIYWFESGVWKVNVQVFFVRCSDSVRGYLRQLKGRRG